MKKTGNYPVPPVLEKPETYSSPTARPWMSLAEAGRVLGLGDDPPVTLDVPVAGGIVGLSRNASYAAAVRGDLPTLRIGRLLKVPVVVFAMLLVSGRHHVGEGDVGGDRHLRGDRHRHLGGRRRRGEAGL